MKVKRIVHSILCLVLCCCILLHSMPVKADATAAGAAALITGTAGVSVAAPLAIGASLIALGIMADNTNPLVFENTVNDAVASLSAAGTWVKDGAVELLQTIDETGQKAYYVAGDMLEDMRSFLFNGSESCSPILHSFGSGGVYIPAGNISLANYCHIDSPVMAYAFYVSTSTAKTVLISNHRFTITNTGGNVSLANELGNGLYYADAYGYNGSSLGLSYIVPYAAYSPYRSKPLEFYEALYRGSINGSELYSAYDLTLGSIPYAGAFTDGSSALEWAEEYARKALKVIEGGNDPDPDSQPPNDGKWFWPLALGLSVGVLGTMSQADEWNGQTPQEFNEYSTKTEYEILDTPEFDGWQGLEIAPATNPSPDAGGDSGSSGDSGDVVVSPDSDSTWFQKIVKGIEELPDKFQSWITDCKTAIEELPSKFSTWLDSIIEWLQKIWESLQTLASNIINGFKQILIELFAPSPDFISNKVNSLLEKYAFLDPVFTLGENLKLYFLGLGAQPPVIYIDLGAATGSYVYGGRTIFIDLRWYEQYKPTMDAIIGGFLWLFLAWRFFMSAPGIIQGNSGIWGTPDPTPDFTFHAPKFQVGKNWLNSGSSYHRKGSGSSDSD